VDLATTDPVSAKTFYGDLFVCEAEEMPAREAGTYTMLSLEGEEVCGFYEMEAEGREGSISPRLFSYVSVENTDTTASRAHELGDTVYGEAFTVLDSGQMAVVQDPTCAVLAAWKPRDHIGADRVNDPSCLTWIELQSRDPETAVFYAGLFS